MTTTTPEIKNEKFFDALAEVRKLDLEKFIWNSKLYEKTVSKTGMTMYRRCYREHEQEEKKEDERKKELAKEKKSPNKEKKKEKKAAAKQLEKAAAKKVEEKKDDSDKVDYSQMTIPELKALCGERNLTKGGKKEDLVSRLNGV